MIEVIDGYCCRSRRRATRQTLSQALRESWS